MIPPPAHVHRITTRNADELQAFIAAHYQDHKRTVQKASHGFEFFAESGALGALTAALSCYKAATIHSTNPPAPFLVATRLNSGRSMMQWHGGEMRLDRRGIMLIPPDPVEVTHEASDTTSVSLTTATLLRVAHETSGLDPAQVGFTGLLPVSRAAENQANATIGYILRGIHTLALDQPLLLAAAEHMVAAIMLSTFPNTTMTTEIRTPRDPGTPATLRRAVAFIDENAALPITLTDIATASGVLPRTLQYAFRRHRDTTPLAYLGRVRIERAHDQLMGADPGDGTTVAAVAARWGYASPSQFAAAYRQVYGQPPSRTLHT